MKLFILLFPIVLMISWTRPKNHSHALKILHKKCWAKYKSCMTDSCWDEMGTEYKYLDSTWTVRCCKILGKYREGYAFNEVRKLVDPISGEERLSVNSCPNDILFLDSCADTRKSYYVIYFGESVFCPMKLTFINKKKFILEGFDGNNQKYKWLYKAIKPPENIKEYFK